MSREDFLTCTPSEFRIIFDQWHRREELKERGRWETARFIATCTLQPYSKKSLKPKDVCVFPWESETDETAVPKGTSSYERMKELEEMMKRKRQ